MFRTSPLQRASRVCVIPVVVAAVVGLAATSAQASGAPPVKAGSDYLALGDSVTFGYMESTVVPAPNYHDASSLLGYPELLGQELHLTVANASCPGETSTSLINPNGPSNGCENAIGSPHAGYRTAFPLHVKYKGSQLAYGVSYLKAHRNTRLVSLMIGANDLFRCQATTKDGCTSASEQDGVFDTVASNVKKILSAVRNKAHYGGQLAILNYYSLNYTSAFITNIVKALNTTVDGAAKSFHVEIASGFDEFKAASAHSGSNPCTAGLLTQIGGGKCGVHPSYAGQSLLAQAIEKAITL
jgi:lysophospholipase L1-like esterase